MLTREQKTKANPLIPILVSQEAEEISLGWTLPNTGFWVPDRSKRKLMGYAVGILNNQMNAKRTAHNVRARLEYEHAEDRFNVDPAGWFITDDSQRLHRYDDHTELEPKRIQRVVLAVRRGESGPFETFAVKAKQDDLVPSMALRFGKWEVKGSISGDHCDSIKFTVTFRIDENGDLVDLQNLAEDTTAPQDEVALATPEEAAHKNRDLIRKTLLNVIKPHLAQDYIYILDVLDHSDRVLMDDSLFKKWVKKYRIQCWGDIAGDEKARALFQKFLSVARRKAKR